ncbi:MAG: glutaredoxin 3 [Magnetovibrionaceae bacterium]
MANVEIYTSPLCGYCHRAKELLTSKGVEFTEYDIFMGRKVRQEMAERTNGASTVPQIFIDDKLIGGCDDLYELESEGGLDPLLQAS